MVMATTGARPGIFKIGTIARIGTQVVVSGWGVNSCARHCDCHKHPVTGQLTLLPENEASTYGLLGLRKHRACFCCEPWKAIELEALLRTLTEIEAIPVTAEEQPS
jgi:hypothetical protein